MSVKLFVCSLRSGRFSESLLLLVRRKGLVCICAERRLWFRRHPAGGDRQSTGLSDMIVRVSRQNKKYGYPNGYPYFLVRRKGLEPLTYWFVASHSIQLSYRRITLSQTLEYSNTLFRKKQVFFEKIFRISRFFSDVWLRNGKG